MQKFKLICFSVPAIPSIPWHIHPLFALSTVAEFFTDEIGSLVKNNTSHRCLSTQYFCQGWEFALWVFVHIARFLRVKV